MAKFTLRLDTAPEGLIARSPAIGRVRLLASWPAVLGAGATVGRLSVLRKDYELVLPETGGPWVVEESLVRGSDVGVGATWPLLRLRLWDDASEASAAGANAGGLAFASPMSGQYYRKPAPDQPPFVSVGDTIEEGAQIGLVEVMKFFYPLIFTMKGRYRVTELLLGESASIDAGDLVLRVEPASTNE